MNKYSASLITNRAKLIDLHIGLPYLLVDAIHKKYYKCLLSCKLKKIIEVNI